MVKRRFPLGFYFRYPIFYIRQIEKVFAFLIHFKDVHNNNYKIVVMGDKQYIPGVTAQQ